MEKPRSGRARSDKLSRQETPRVKGECIILLMMMLMLVMMLMIWWC